jgi:hypothetical protein
MDLEQWLSVGNNWVVLCTVVLAIAALGQFELTRRTAKRQLRAYVMPELASIADYSTIKPPPPAIFTGHLGAAVLIKNSGQTPAYKLVHWGAVIVLPANMEDSLMTPKRLPEIAATTLGPGCTIHRTGWTEAKISTDQINAIRSGESKVFVYGKIIYRDAFRRRRETTYRLSYAGNYPPHEGATMQFCVQGNTAD